MEPFLLCRSVVQAAPKPNARLPSRTWVSRWGSRSCRRRELGSHPNAAFVPPARPFTTTSRRALKEQEDPYKTKNLEDSSYSQPAGNLSQNVTDGEKDHFKRIEEESKDRQMRAPWMRDGSDAPPVARNRTASAMTKGKLLVTPSRMLKLILPLTTKDFNSDRKDIEPLALLVHPQQPLSYLERLIQSEIPLLESGKPPAITFRAQDAMEEDIWSKKSAVQKGKEEEGGEPEYDIEEAEETMVDGELARTGKISQSSSTAAAADKARPTDEPEETPPRDPPGDPEAHANFVRWSPSTEIGDFIRDAARGKEFGVDIEAASAPIYVGVPSFSDRTYYLRMRLRKTAQRIGKLAGLKKECDDIAHRSAQRVAQAGFTGLIGWWATVYYLTFKTELGWDVMEPVTYLVSLSGLIGGYMWFLYHNREASYRSAMNLTISRRQSALYEKKGFNVRIWEGLVEEGNRLRREIKMVADEYDVEWDESRDEGNEEVKEALKKGRQKKKEEKKEKEEEEDEDDGGDEGKDEDAGAEGKNK